MNGLRFEVLTVKSSYEWMTFQVFHYRKLSDRDLAPMMWCQMRLALMAKMREDPSSRRLPKQNAGSEPDFFQGNRSSDRRLMVLVISEMRPILYTNPWVQMSPWSLGHFCEAQSKPHVSWMLTPKSFFPPIVCYKAPSMALWLESEPPMCGCAHSQEQRATGGDVRVN